MFWCVANAPYRLLVTAAIDVVVGNAHPTSTSVSPPTGGDQGGIKGG